MIRNKSIKIINLYDIYVIFYVLYTYANMYIQKSTVALGTFLPMFLICLYGLYQTIFKYKVRGYIMALVVFISFLSIYGIFHWMGGEYVEETKPSSFLFGSFISLAPVLVFYVGTKKEAVNENRMRFYFIVFLILAILQYYHSFSERDLTIEGSVTSEGATNNIAYYFVCMLPMVFLFKKKMYLQYAGLIVLLFFIMSGMKRGAILTMAIFILFFIRFTIKKENSIKNNRNTILSIILTIVSAYVIYYFVQSVWLNNDYFYARLQRIQEGDTNGRNDIYKTLWHHFLTNNNFFQMFFGLGAEGTMRVAHIHAHNDWLELLTDCGIIGVFVYLVYFYCLYKDCRKYKQITPEVYIVVSCCVILFVRSFFSMSYMDMHISISSVLGYGLAVCEQKYKDVVI